MAKRLWELFYTFAKVGVMTFGGGMLRNAAYFAARGRGE